MSSDVDDDGSGTMGYGDFLQMMTHQLPNGDPKYETLKAFRLFGGEESGKRLFNNLKRAANGLGGMMTGEELQEMIDEAGRDGD